MVVVVAVDVSRSPGNSLLSIVLNFVVVDEEGAVEETAPSSSAFATGADGADGADGAGEEVLGEEVHKARKAQISSNSSFFWLYPPPLYEFVNSCATNLSRACPASTPA